MTKDDLPARPSPRRGPLAPTGPGERIAALDVARGAAILGILPANLPFFALPVGAASAAHYVSPHASEAVAFAALDVLVEYKFVTIFSLLFGAGLELQRQRARAARRPFASYMARRLLILLGLGLAHGWFLWYGDILAWYALVGLLALLLLDLGPRAQLALGAALAAAIPLACLALGPVAGPALDGSLRGFLDAAWVSPDTAEAALASPAATASPLWDLHAGRETLVYREGGYAEQLLMRLVIWASSALMIFGYFFWRTLGLVLAGAAATRLGLLARPDEHRALWRRLVLAGLAVGLPLELAHAAASVGRTATSPGVFTHWLVYQSLHELGSLGLALAYVGLLAHVRPGSAPGRRLGAVGRTALSCYLGQTVACVLLFYSFGVGLFGALTRLDLWSLALLLAALQLVVAPWWTRRFRMGPVEWAWRSLSYGRAQPFALVSPRSPCAA